MSIETIKNMAGIGQITNLSDYVDQQARYLVKPVTARGIGGFVFSTRDDEQITLQSEVTDYAIEDNSTVGDHIAIKPIMVTLRGYVGEIVYNHTTTSVPAISSVANRLTSVASYLPSLSTLANQIKTKVQAVNDLAGAATNLINSTQNLVSSIVAPLATRQQQAYNVLKSMWQSKQVFTLETPWEYLDNMVIMTLLANQDNKTEMISDFTVTLKQLRVAKTFVEFRGASIFSMDAAQYINKSQVKGATIGLTEISLLPITSTNQKGALNYMVSN